MNYPESGIYDYNKNELENYIYSGGIDAKKTNKTIILTIIIIIITTEILIL